MKKNIQWLFSPPLTVFIAGIFLLLSQGCRRHEPQNQLDEYKQTNLVSDSPGLAARVDPTLVNAWGIAVAPSGPIWIASNHTSLTQVYDKNGMELRPPITILGGEGAPTGVVFNGTSKFVIPADGQPARFIFAGEDGTLSAWNGASGSAVKVADQSASHAVYKGLAMDNVGPDTFLYATNFHAGKIDVFDKDFNLVTDKPFSDPDIPAGYAPFNIRNIGGWLYVTYAKQMAPDNMDDEKGPGNGYINIFDSKGERIKRFASRGALNSPWGIVASAPGFADGNSILVGNFGDGRIHAYHQDGSLIGALREENGNEIVIDGLWALENNIPGTDTKQLYFTAGPADEEHGLFGYLRKN
jgi:uncharacterized protein (TIGR03118 family)